MSLAINGYSMAMEFLFHYTSLSALHNMLMNSRAKDDVVFWASDITMMNDPDELAYGISKAKDYLRKLEVKRKVEQQKRLSSLIKPYCHYANRNIEMAKDLPALYAISFSEDSDSLPMWRTYSDEARGVCLKVCDSIINLHIINNDKHVDFCDKVNDESSDGIKSAEIEYEEIEEGSSAANLISSQFEEYQKDASNEKLKCRSLALIQLFGGMSVKRPQFQYEKEHRLYGGFNNKRMYRLSRHGMLIPYVELPIKKSNIKGIILGPAFNEANKVPLIKLLCDAGLGNITFEDSKIHYRNM